MRKAIDLLILAAGSCPGTFGRVIDRAGNFTDAVQKPSYEYRVFWNGRKNPGQPVASGVYCYRLVTKDFFKSKKMALLK